MYPLESCQDQLTRTQLSTRKKSRKTTEIKVLCKTPIKKGDMKYVPQNLWTMPNNHSPSKALTYKKIQYQDNTMILMTPA